MFQYRMTLRIHGIRGLFSLYDKNDNTSLESELIALFLDVDGFLDVE